MPIIASDHTTFRRQIACLLATLAILGLVWGSCLRRVPEIRGRVVNASTGKPVFDALVGRLLCRTPPFDLLDTRAEAPIAGSWVQTRTDHQGRFVLPGDWAWRLARIDWLTYKAGLMPGQGWYRRLGWGENNPGFYTSQWPDPWVKVKSQEQLGRLTLELHLISPDAEAVTPESSGGRLGGFFPGTQKPTKSDPWGEYFRRLEAMTRDRLVPTDEFVRDAVHYLEAHNLTEGMILPLASLTDRINVHQAPTLTHERCSVLHAIAQYCRSSSHGALCALPTVILCLRDYDETCQPHKEPR